jgi:DNA-binding transcriptional MerR regulator
MTVYDSAMSKGKHTSSTAGSGANEATWTIHQLCALAEAALLRDYNGPADGRAQAHPNERMLRYYMTLGLLDRPSAWRARTALYGLRHLRQIVAVKRLQERGLSLVTIQERLLGLDDDALAKLALLPPDVAAGGPLAAPGGPLAAPGGPPAAAAEDAAASAPEPPAPAATAAPPAPSAVRAAPAAHTARGRAGFWRDEPSACAESESPCANLHTHALGPDLVIVWRGRAATPEAEQELRQAAGTLRDTLRRHGLTDPAGEAPTDGQRPGNPPASPGSSPGERQ